MEYLLIVWFTYIIFLFINKWFDPRLDRKSSRGMLYENEELRLRTININAEVERGNILLDWVGSLVTPYTYTNK